MAGVVPGVGMGFLIVVIVGCHLCGVSRPGPKGEKHRCNLPGGQTEVENRNYEAGVVWAKRRSVGREGEMRPGGKAAADKRWNESVENRRCKMERGSSEESAVAGLSLVFRRSGGQGSLIVWRKRRSAPGKAGKAQQAVGCVGSHCLQTLGTHSRHKTLFPTKRAVRGLGRWATLNDGKMGKGRRMSRLRTHELARYFSRHSRPYVHITGFARAALSFSVGLELLHPHRHSEYAATLTSPAKHDARQPGRGQEDQWGGSAAAPSILSSPANTGWEAAAGGEEHGRLACVALQRPCTLDRRLFLETCPMPGLRGFRSSHPWE